MDGDYVMLALREYMHFLRMKMVMDGESSSEADKCGEIMAGCSAEMDQIWHEHLCWNSLDYSRLLASLGLPAGSFVHHSSSAFLCADLEREQEDIDAMLKAALERCITKRAAMAEWGNPAVKWVWGRQVECSICLEPVKPGERRAVLNSCDHQFHWRCISEVRRQQGPVDRRAVL